MIPTALADSLSNSWRSTLNSTPSPLPNDAPFRRESPRASSDSALPGTKRFWYTTDSSSDDLSGEGGTALTSYLNSTVFFLCLIVTSLFTGAFFLGSFAAILAFAATYLIRGHFMTEMLPVLPDEAVLVTGTSSGIGRSTAITLCQQGYTVFCGLRGEKLREQFQYLQNDVGESLSKRLIAVQLDVTESTEIAAARSQIKAELKRRNARLIAVVQCAGHALAGPLEITKADDFRLQLDVNVIGPTEIANQMLPLLRQSYRSSNRRSRLIFISSAQGSNVAGGTSAYAASKHGLEAVADGFRQEVSKMGVDSIIVIPGLVQGTYLYPKARKTRELTIAHGRDLQKQGRIEADVMDGYVKALLKQHKTVDWVTSTANNKKIGVTNTIIESLQSSRPLARYISGSDVAVVIPLLRRLPDRLADTLLGAAFG